MVQSVCLAGLGHIGLPTAAVLAEAGLQVYGFDIDERRVAAVNEGRSSVDLPELGTLVASVVRAGRLAAGRRPAAADAFVIAVPTPLGNGNVPDISHIRAAVGQIAPLLDKGNLVVLESTSPVGTTEQVCRWLAAARTDLSFPHDSGEDSDIRVAYCPERANPGRLLDELVNNDRVIGGITPACAERAGELYGVFVKGGCHLSDSRLAEMAKLAENAYRDVNIAFANEMSLVCHTLGVDPWEMIRLANRHPRVDILRPGPGVGGHCIPIDPWFITNSEERLAPLIRAARHVNDAKTDWVAKQVVSASERLGSPVIACLGLTYKADVADLRESPAVAVVKQLQSSIKGRLVCVEPHISALPDELAQHRQTELSDLDSAVEASEIVVLLTGHRRFRSLTGDRLAGKLLVDPRGFWADQAACGDFRPTAIVDSTAADRAAGDIAR